MHTKSKHIPMLPNAMGSDYFHKNNETDIEDSNALLILITTNYPHSKCMVIGWMDDLLFFRLF